MAESPTDRLINPRASSAVTLAFRPRPFSMDRRVIDLPPGCTILDMVEVAQIEPGLREFVHARLGEHLVPRDRWHRVKPKAGSIVHLAVLPAGNNVLATVLTIAVVAAGLAAAPLLVPVIGAFGAAAVAASISIGGSMLINSLVPPSLPTAPQQGGSSPTYSLTGGSNRARPFESIPRVLGYHRMTPDLAAPWVTDIDGDNVYLCGILCWGYGPLEISELRIGDTAIESYQDVQIETIPGWPDDEPNLSLYPATISPLAVQTKLTRSGGWVSRTTMEGTDAAVIELALPTGGLQFSKNQESRQGIYVDFEIAYAAFASDTWLAAPNFRISAKTQSAVRRTVRINFPYRGQWDVRVRRITADVDPEDNDRNRIDESWWISFRSHRNEAPIAKKGLCLTALRIKATEQLSGTIDDLSGLAKSVCSIWHTEEQQWISQPSNEPHTLFRTILQDNGAKQRISDDKLDFATLEAWGAYCRDRSLACNIVIDQAISTWEALRLVAATGRASPTCATGIWSVIVDEPQDTPRQHFTPRNSKNFKGRRIFVDMPHALRCRFVDESNDYKNGSERIVYDDGYDWSNATKFEQAEFPGVTDPEQIYRLARWQIAHAKLRSETFELETSYEWLSVTRGDRVTVANDVVEWGTGSGRVAELVYNGAGLATAIRLDAKLLRTPDFAYSIRLRGLEVPLVLRLTGSGFSDLFTLAEPTSLPVEEWLGALATVGVVDREVYDCIVLSISPGSDLSAKLTLIPYAEGVFNADRDVIPPWDSGSTPDPTVDKPYILSIRSGEIAGKRNADGSLYVQVLVSLYDDGSRPLTQIAAVELRWTEVDSGAPWRYSSYPADARELVIGDAEDNTTIWVSVRYVKRDGKPGPWTAAERHFVDGPNIPPPDVASVYLDGDDVAWSYPTPPPDLWGFYVRYSGKTDTPWAGALPISDTVFTGTLIPAASVPTEAKEVLVKAVTVAGLESINPARLTVTPGMIARRVEFETIDMAGLGYPGTVKGGEVTPARVLRATDTSRFLSPRKSSFLSPRTGLFLDANWAQLSYEFQVTVGSSIRTGDRVYLEIVGSGNFVIERRWAGEDIEHLRETDQLPDWLLTPPDAFILGTRSIGLIGVFEEGVFAPGVFTMGNSKLWVPWRNGLRPLAGETLNIRVRAAGGASDRVQISGLKIVFDAAEVTEDIANVRIPASGIRLPLTRDFRGIRWVYGQLINVGRNSAARTVVVDDLTLTSGPRIHAEAYDGTWVEADALVRVGGY